MIKDTKETIDKYKLEKRAKLSLIGIRMHVLADTWAHQNFSGVSDSFWEMTVASSGLNQIYGTLQKEENNNWRNIPWVSPNGDTVMAPNMIM